AYRDRSISRPDARQPPSDGPSMLSIFVNHQCTLGSFLSTFGDEIQMVGPARRVSALPGGQPRCAGIDGFLASIATAKVGGLEASVTRMGSAGVQSRTSGRPAKADLTVG